MRTAIPLTAVFLMAGCASVKTSLHQPADAVPPEKGVVVFSTGANDASYVSVLMLSLTAMKHDGSSSNIETDASMNRGYDRSDFADEHGQVRMMFLDEGTYCLYPRHTNPYVKLTGTIPNFAFRVKKGTVRYVGSIYMNGLNFSIRNREARDMQRALAAHPELAKLPATAAPAVRLPKCTNDI